MADYFPEEQLSHNEDEDFMIKEPSRTKSRKIFIFTLLTGILLTIWMVNRQKASSNLAKSSQKNIVTKLLNGETKKETPALAKRMSIGDKILIGADDNPDKQIATSKFAEGDLAAAQTKFVESLKRYPNDPESLIYLNNSLTIPGRSTVTLGVSIPIGGSLNVAKEILRGVAQAQNEINQQGGIERDGNNYLLRIQLANDDNNPEIAKQVAASFVADKEILGVVGHNSSSSSIAAAPVYQNGGLVMISPTSVARELSQAGNYIFRTTPSTRVLAETLAEHAVEGLRRQKIAICIDSKSPASQSFKDEFSLSLFELGGEVTSTDCDFASEDFNPSEIPSQAIADGAEALLFIPSVNKINQALEVAKANENRLVMLGNHSMYTYETLRVGNSDINGIVLPTAWHQSATSEPLFNKNAQKLWGTVGNWRTATAYDATKALIRSLKSSGDRRGVQKALANPGFRSKGALGKINFQPSGDRQVSATLVKVQPGDISGTGYDFEPLDSEAEPRKLSAIKE